MDAPWSPARLAERTSMKQAPIVRTDIFLQLLAVVESARLTALVPGRLAAKRCQGSATRWVAGPQQIAPALNISVAWRPDLHA